jgi:DNA-binding XRE family transcriptional regulator
MPAMVNMKVYPYINDSVSIWRLPLKSRYVPQMADRVKGGTYDSHARRLLAAYLADHGISQAKFARIVGLTPLAMSNIMTGRIKHPRLPNAVAIELETMHRVKCLDWLKP